MKTILIITAAAEVLKSFLSKVQVANLRNRFVEVKKKNKKHNSLSNQIPAINMFFQIQ